MRVLKKFIAMSAILMVLGVTFLYASAASNQETITAPVFPAPSLPSLALSAIQKSQAQIVVRIPLTTGGMRILQGNGVLVKRVQERGLVVTAFHVVPSEVDIARTEERIFFGEIPARLFAAAPGSENGLALLQIEQIPDGMEPITIADEVSHPTPIYALIKGLYNYRDGVIGFFPYLPFRGTVVSKASHFSRTAYGLVSEGIEYLYIENAARSGFSGAAFVDERGILLGIGAFLDGGYTVAVSHTSIQELLDSAQPEKD